ncbi:MAG TPA: circularly permuted type 2 ATP-grasp protein [Solirubrobacteraceae bacterium]|nr:circularly permuted type 2 ATP-grasp protein [Solirubrobacteraceae bacterium]
MAPYEEATPTGLGDVERLREAAFERVERAGLLERPDGTETSFPLDPVPRVLRADEWDALKGGLAQRVKALCAFVADAYGPRRIVQAGIVPSRVIETAEQYEPQMRGVEPPGGHWVGIAGLDLVRDPEGEFLVLEDNLMTPSGFAYAAAARDAVAGSLNSRTEQPRDYDELPDLLAGALRAGEDDHLVVLTEGQENGAYWEHAWAAEQLGVPVVTPEELRRDGDRLMHGDLQVDVIYRRTDADTLHTAVGGLIAPAIRAGTVSVVNAFGVGVGDDKLTHAYVEDMIRFYLGEEPLVRSVQTLDFARRDHLEEALDRFEELVIKPRAGSGGRGVTVCPLTERAEVEALREEVRADPEQWVAQPVVELSTHATLIDGKLAPRHVDLRPFVFMHGPDRPRVMPGGLTRYAVEEGAMVVNSTQNGGFKDTWVLAR